MRARERRTSYTPLIFACYIDKRGESALIARYLLERGAELDARVRDGSTPLMVAVQSARYDVTQTLLCFGADLAARDELSRLDLAIARIGKGDAQGVVAVALAHAIQREVQRRALIE